YITASIILQLLTVAVPHLEHLQKEEGEAGRRKIAQYTRYGTLAIGAFQAFMISQFIVRSGGVLPGANMAVVIGLAVIVLTTGALFSLWVAEMMTARGIGNGGSLLVFIGIISRLPITFGQIGQVAASATPAQAFMLLMLLVVFFATIGFVVILQEAVRKVFIVSARRQVGSKVMSGQNTHIPFKINPGGVMPIIFAFAVIAFPTQILSYLLNSGINFGAFDSAFVFFVNEFSPGGSLYIAFEVLLIFFFTFFWASIMPNMQPKDIADNLKKYGSSIPGIKPGRPTAAFLQDIFSKITFIGAAFLAVIVLVPNTIESTLAQGAGIQIFRGLGTTSLIILVAVAIDFVSQIRVNMLARQYEGFLKP
ncbi:MAG: preprotein translocase subunit SecY, partial [Cyanobacteria bacterium HKST-UBA03]|nr:preprotein translocase subunit SecY [Cyanobacteria bacterium HKST-UBA03]